MTRLRLAAVFAAALCIGVPACSTDMPSALRSLSMHLLLPATTLTVGQTSTATVVVTDGAGNPVAPSAITWSSSNPTVATVTAAKVTALAAGTTLISASSEGLADSATLTVTDVPVAPVAAVVVGLNAATITAGQSTQATATTKDASGAVLTGRVVTWSSDNTNVATVSSSGLVIGAGAGTAQITATSEGKTGSATIQVNAAPVSSTPTQLTMALQPAGAVSGLPLSTQPAVQVRDAAGLLVTSASNTVTVAITSGSGTLLGTTSVAAVNGLATFSNLRIDGVGAQTLTFTSNGLTAATATITVTQTPAALSIQTQPAGATTGLPLTTQPVLRILDNAGLLIANSTLGVTATVASGTATVSGGTATAVGGVATFTNLRLDGSGSVTLRFQTTTPTLQVVSAAVPVAVGAASKITMTTQPTATATSGVALATQPVVQLRDAANNAVLQAGVNVTAAIASGGGTLGGTVTVATNASGVASFTNLMITGTSGPRTLSFSATGLTSVTSNTITVSTVATQLAITTQPSASVTNGLPFPQQPVIQLRDASGTAVGQAGVVVTAAIASGGGTLGGTLTATTNASGAATFTNLSISGTDGARTLGFSAPALTGATSGTVTVTTVVAQPGSCTNEPVGYSTITDMPWDQTPAHPTTVLGWIDDQWDAAANAPIVTDATSPWPSTNHNVAAGTFPQGFPGGSAPFYIWRPFAASEQFKNLFICVWVKHSANFDNTNGNAGTKFLWPAADQQQGTQTYTGHNGPAMEFAFFQQGAVDRILDGNVGSFAASTVYGRRGQWVKYEMLIKASTSNSTADGQLDVWMDGVQTHHYTNVQWQMSSARTWLSLAWNPTYGGGFNPVPATQYQYIDHIHVSGSNQ